MKLYGLKDGERLESSVEDAMIRVLDRVPGESFEQCLDLPPWPVKLHVYKPMEVGGEQHAQSIARSILESELNTLDEEYGDPDGDYTEPTEAMKEAALTLARVILRDYKPWVCEFTGEVVEIPREEAEKYGW